MCQQSDVDRIICVFVRCLLSQRESTHGGRLIIGPRFNWGFKDRGGWGYGLLPGGCYGGFWGRLAPNGTTRVGFHQGAEGGKKGFSTSLHWLLMICPQADDDEIYGTGQGNHTKAPHYPKYSRLKTFLLS